MASAFSHAIASIALGKASFIKKTDTKFWVLAAFCAVIPDADVIGYKMGVPYDSMYGHRGFTHSLFFAALLAVIVVYFFYKEEKPFSSRWWVLTGFFFVATASHGVLDAMTTGGRGVAFFAPFSDARYFFPFRPIKVSPIGVTRFFSQWGLEVLKSEFVWIWIPSFIIIAAVRVINKMRT
ncbi:MAG TPA: metal-dependent hydrolase [Chitinophagales bacterium]|nr:metal-dependent hydrolase [Chitinophagales bacterium]